MFIVYVKQRFLIWLSLQIMGLGLFEIFVIICQSAWFKVIEDLNSQQLRSEKLHETLQILTFPSLRLFILLS